jgi:hypothetical protein
MERSNHITININLRVLKIFAQIFTAIIFAIGTITMAYAQTDAGERVQVLATVAGWFNVRQINPQNIAISTNMAVWVNGTKFIKCANETQPVNFSYFSAN